MSIQFNKVGLLASDAPKHWWDASGKQWRTPAIKGRLKFKGPGYRALREFVLSRDGYACQYCGLQFPEDTSVVVERIGYLQERVYRLVADHVISRENGGAHHPLNLVAACEGCNSKKAATVDSRSGT